MATLKVTHTEDIVLQGRQQGTTRTMSFNNITDVYSRVFSFRQGTSTSLYTTHETTLTGGSVFDDGSIKYVRITNLGLEPLTINVKVETAGTSSGNMSYAYEIQPNESYYLYSHTVAVLADTTDDMSTSELGTSLKDIDEVKAYCHRGVGKVEVMVASTDAK
mgnify:CR=1 FL=1|tara:strand:- start:1523 stop:2008 length:486 start_codon:yes stop_codon:yes gene_type:complete